MELVKYLNCIGFLLLLFSCQQEEPPSVSSPSAFQLKSSANSGITFSNDLINSEALNIINYLYYYNGGGVAIGDINDDGLEDIYFTANQHPDKLYLNTGNLTFKDFTKSAGILEENSWSSGVVIDDVNGDGLNDIYVSKVGVLTTEKGHNLLYINQGGGKFEEQSKALGLDFSGFATQACFLDYDKDGDLDVYLLNHTVHSVRSYGTAKKRLEKDSLSGDRFYENKINEIGRFEEVTDQAGIYNSPLGYGLAISAADINNDGWTDIYVGNDFHENDYLYINNGDKTFTESIKTFFPYTSQFSMGVDLADVNNDGRLDIFSTDMMPFDPKVVLKSGGEDTDQIKRIKKELGFEGQNARNHFHLSNGSEYAEVAFMTGTFATDWSWSVLMQDFNNDAQADIFITNGIVGRPNDLDYINYINSQSGEIADEALIEKMPAQPLRNILFLGEGEQQYSDLQASFSGTPSFSNGAAYGDLDQDGDLDLIVNNINEPAFVMENQSAAGNNYLSIQLKNGVNNKTLKGTKVRLKVGAKTFFKEYQTIKGFQSSSSHLLHFGLGAAEKVATVEVVWPDNSQKTIKDVSVNQKLEITFDDKKGERIPKTVKVGEIGSDKTALSFIHVDNSYYDEQSEGLVPERLSYEGPALLCEDLNGDGLVDIYVGGGRNQAATLFLGTVDGKYKFKELEDFKKDARYEDIDAATIDFDADGDLDIYVISGGNDFKELDKLNEDRLYLNNGNGEFKRIPLSLPHTNGSTIAVHDFDQDGYSDLFIGASTIPGSYGLSPFSFLLKNKKGTGLEINFKNRLGMVKDSKWADIDGDGDMDLAVCGDWMSIKILINESGTFKDETATYGLTTQTGFWNSIEFIDLNKDGKLDMLAGNEGLNNKWSASEAEPIKLYIGDFDENGTSDPIIFYKYLDRYVPFNALDKLKSQLPAIKKGFETYEDFSKVGTMEALLPGYKANLVESKNVSELRSMIFLQKDKVFEGHALGKEEQKSCINDFAVSRDGGIFYIGNSTTPVAKLGPGLANAGRQLINFNKEKNEFEYSISLGLPKAYEGRKVEVVEKDKLIVVGNNEQAYLVKMHRKDQ